SMAVALAWRAPPRPGPGTRGTSRPGAGRRVSLEGVDERLALALAEAGCAARGVDPGLLEQRRDLGGAVAGEALQQVGDLRLPDDLVGLGAVEHRGDGLLAAGDRVAELLAGGAG